MAEFTSRDCAQFIERYAAEVYAFLRGMVVNPDIARELAQDTMVAVWQAARQQTPPFVFGADDDERRRWMFRVAYHQAISALRRARLIQWESLEDADNAEVAFPERAFDGRIADIDVMQRALRELKPLDVACLSLIVVQGFTIPEAALILEQSAQAVAKRLQRAKQRLQQAYMRQNSANDED